jgi:NitT/TauT family transport system substrate-binding protein
MNHVIRLHGERYLRRLPSRVAYEERIFEDEGLDVHWIEPDPVRQAEEPLAIQDRMKESMLETGQIDVYKVCQWGGIKRSIEGQQAQVFAVERQGGTYAHAIVASPNSGIRQVPDLADRPIGINQDAGSFYRVHETLERYLPENRIKTIHAGSPLQRLYALLNGQIAAAEFMDLSVSLAEAKGLVKVLDEKDSKPGVFIAQRHTPVPALLAFMNAWNRAVNRINARQEDYQLKAIREFNERLPSPLRVAEEELTERFQFIDYAEIGPYPRGDFEDTYHWMRKKGLVSSGFAYEDVTLLME